jgi:CheY-like chemotaxis protein
MNKPTVLIAGTQPAIDTAEHLLGSEVDTMAARSLDEALERLAAHPDLILCNVRFDESRMFDLLKEAKSRPETHDTPFVCFRLAPLPEPWRACIEQAVLAVGATAFVDLSAVTEEKLREVVLSHLPH